VLTRSAAPGAGGTGFTPTIVKYDERVAALTRASALLATPFATTAAPPPLSPPFSTPAGTPAPLPPGLAGRAA
jgi:hypothetical protein